jgi:NTE family protein
MLSFSGGGTRAAALSYGVLKELADTRIRLGSAERRLLDEVDIISSVSGGSFTNAYYGLFGDRIFEDFEKRVLRRPIEADLIKQLSRPTEWRRLASPYYGRSDMAANYYDRNIFDGATFADLRRADAPLVLINASDINTGRRMVFSQEFFNLLCVDLQSYSVARAVAASSAVPGAATPITLANHAGQCGYRLPDWLRIAPLDPEAEGSMRRANRNAWREYLDLSLRPWLQLVDGGITDNLGLRAYYAFFELNDDFQQLLTEFSHPQVEDVLIIAVNAALEHQWPWARQAEHPSGSEVLSAMTATQMSNYTGDTLHIVRASYQDWARSMARAGKPVEFDFVEVSFFAVEDQEQRRQLNAIPTKLQLPDQQIDLLIETGRHLLRDSVRFRRFVARHGGTTDRQPSTPTAPITGE